MHEKSEQMNMKLQVKAKNLLKAIAYKEHRSMTNMVERLIYEYCEKHGISEQSDSPKAS